MPTYYLVFEKVQRRSEMQFESRALSRASSEIDNLADRAGLKMLLDYTYVDVGDLTAAIPPDAQQIPQWFTAREGVDWLTAVISVLRKQPLSVESPDTVLADLFRCRDVLVHAAASGLRWRFGVDI